MAWAADVCRVPQQWTLHKKSQVAIAKRQQGGGKPFLLAGNPASFSGSYNEPPVSVAGVNDAVKVQEEDYVMKMQNRCLGSASATLPMHTAYNTQKHT